MVALPGRDETLQSADEATLTEARFKTDGPALLEFFRKRILSETDRARLQGTVQRLGDVSFRVREQASADLLRAGESAQSFLEQAVHDPDLEVARRATRCLEHLQGQHPAAFAQTMAAVRLLAVRRPQGTIEVLLDYLPFVNEEGSRMKSSR